MRGRGGPIIVVTTLAACAACSLLVSAEGLTGARPATDAGVGFEASTGADAAREGDAPAGATSCGSGAADPDLVAYYPLDEDAGTVARDCSGHGHDGVVLSTAPGGSWVPGLWGGGFRGDGTAGCIEIGNPPELLLEQRAFTVTVWTRANTYAGPNDETRYVVGRARNADSRGWRIGGDAPSKLDVELAVPNASSIYVSSDPLATNTWVHFAVIFEPGVRASIYVNGAPDGDNPMPSSGILADDAATLRIACRGTNDRWFDGVIDEVRIYRRVLSQVEIAALAKKP
jgi:hypothetical protein